MKKIKVMVALALVVVMLASICMNVSFAVAARVTSETITECNQEYGANNYDGRTFLSEYVGNYYDSVKPLDFTGMYGSYCEWCIGQIQNRGL